MLVGSSGLLHGHKTNKATSMIFTVVLMASSMFSAAYCTVTVSATATVSTTATVAVESAGVAAVSSTVFVSLHAASSTTAVIKTNTFFV